MAALEEFKKIQKKASSKNHKPEDLVDTSEEDKKGKGSPLLSSDV